MITCVPECPINLVYTRIESNRMSQSHSAKYPFMWSSKVRCQHFMSKRSRLPLQWAIENLLRFFFRARISSDFFMGENKKRDRAVPVYRKIIDVIYYKKR